MNQKCPRCSALIAPNEPACRACGSPRNAAPSPSPANPPAPNLSNPNLPPPGLPNPNLQTAPSPFNQPGQPGPTAPDQAPPVTNYGPPASPPPYPSPQGSPQPPGNLPQTSYNNKNKPGSKIVLLAVILVIFALVCFGSYIIFFRSDDSTDETSQSETDENQTDDENDGQTNADENQDDENQETDDNQDGSDNNQQSSGDNPTFAEIFGVTDIEDKYDIAETDCETQELDTFQFSFIFKVDGYQPPEDSAEVIKYHRCYPARIFTLSDFNGFKSLVYGDQVLICDSEDAATIINSPSNLYYKMTAPDGRQFVMTDVNEYIIEDFESYDASIEKFNYCE